MYLNSSIPTILGYLDPGFLYNTEPNIHDLNSFVPVEIFAVCSIPRRCLMFSVMTEMGSQHARVPIHYLRSQITNSTSANIYPLDWLQLWDSFSNYFSVNRIDYLKNASCKVLLKNKNFIRGKYLFTIDWCNGPDYELGYSELASGHKCAHLIELENGQYAAQPNNRIVWSDGGAWIGSQLQGHQKWKVFGREFSCEAMGYKWKTGEEELMHYDFVEEKSQFS
jgi:hypothetical protein